MALTVTELKIALSVDDSKLKSQLQGVARQAQQTIEGSVSATGGGLKQGLDSAGAAAEQTTRRVDTLADSARRFGYGAVTVGQGLTNSITRPLAEMGMQSLRVAAEFDQAMRNVNSIAKLSDSAFAEMRKGLLSVAADPNIRQGPVDLAKGLYDVYSSGFSGAKALDILRVGAKGASAGMTDASVSTRALMLVMNSGIKGVTSAGQAMDILFREVDLGVNSFAELANTLGPVIPMAKMAGVSLQDVAAAQATMTRNGINLARTNTSLANLFAKMVAPTGPMLQAADQIGIKFGAAALKGRTFTQWLEDAKQKIEAYAKSHNSIQIGKQVFPVTGPQDLYKRLFPDVRAMTSFAVLTQQQGTFQNLRGRFDNVGGATQAALAEQNKGAVAQMELLRKEFGLLQVQVATTFGPFVQQLVGGLRQLVQWFGQLSPQAQRVGLVLAGIAAAAGPLVMFIGNVALGFSTLAPLVAGAGPALAAVAAVLSGPVGLAVAAVAAGVAALALAWRTNFGGIRDTAMQFVASVAPPLRAFWAEVQQTFTVGVGYIRQAIALLAPVVVPLWASMWDNVRIAFAGVWQIISGILQVALAALTTGIRVAMAVVRGDWSGALEAMRSGLSLAWNGIKTIWSGIGTWLGGWAVNIAKLFGKAAQDVVQGFVNGIRGGVGRVTSAVEGMGRSVVAAAKGALGIRSPSAVFMQIGENVVDGLVIGLIRSTSRVNGPMASLGAGMAAILVGTLQGIERQLKPVRDAIHQTWIEIKMLQATTPEARLALEQFGIPLERMGPAAQRAVRELARVRAELVQVKALAEIAKGTPVASRLDEILRPGVGAPGSVAAPNMAAVRATARPGSPGDIGPGALVGSEGLGMPEAVRKAQDVQFYLGQASMDFRNNLQNAFQNLMTGRGGIKGFFSDIMGGIRQSFARIAAELLAQWAIRQLLGSAGGQGGAGGGGMAGGQMSGSQVGAAIGMAAGGPIGAAIGGALGGLLKFAGGGRPPLGVPSIVGERGPELFVPDRPGTILPNGQGLGGMVVNVTQQVYGGINREADEARVAERIAADVQRALRYA